MMKFSGWYDQHPEFEKKENRKLTPREWQLRASHWPTVDEVDEILSPMYADTVLQILRGQGYSYGYEVKFHRENSIPTYGEKSLKKIDTRSPEKSVYRVQAEKHAEQVKVRNTRAKRKLKTERKPRRSHRYPLWMYQEEARKLGIHEYTLKMVCLNRGLSPTEGREFLETIKYDNKPILPNPTPVIATSE